MKLLSGSALPPSQEGPKTGELKIRVERLVLQHDKLDEERYADFCATECLWWGEENGPTSGYETPSTSTSSRGVVVYSYPIRTTRKLMGEYLELMNKNWGGLRIRVLVPASISGKKTNTPVGEAEILLDTLKPRSPISGWFAVQGPPAGEEGPAGGVLATGDAIVIGKVKLSVHMHYYNTKEKEESQKRAEVEEQQVVAARGRSASVGSGGSRSRTGTPEGAAATAGSGSATGAGGHTDPHTSDQPVGVVGIGLASHPGATHPSTSDETTVVGSHTQGMGPVLRHQNYLEDILLRGQQLRQQMVSSMQQSGGSYGNGQGGASIGARSALPPMASVSGAGGTAGTRDNAGASADLPHNVKETMYSIQGKIDAQRAVHEGRNRVVTAGGHATTEGEENNGQPPEVTLFYPQPFIGERIKDSVKDLYDDDDDNDLISSSSSSSSGGDCGYESEDELAALRCRGSQNHQLEPLKSYHGMHHAVIRITGLSFSRVMTEVRFKLRVSDDVTFVQPLAELVSPILELPWTGAIEFVLCLASYTNKSKIVLEAHEIISQYDPAKEANILMSEKLVGISVVGVFAQQQDFLSFHDPVHGGDPVRCSLLVSLDPVATEADRQVFLAAAKTVAEEQVRRRAEDKEGRRPEQQQQQHDEAQQEVHQQVPAVPVAPPVPAAQQHPAKKSAPKSAAYHNNHRSTTTSTTGSPSGLVKSPGQSNAGGGSANSKRNHNSATPSKARATSNAVPPIVAAPTQPPQQQQPAAKPTSLFVLEVAVDYGKGLPEVEQYDSDVPEAPSTFVAIEDVFVNARAGGGGSSLASVSPNVQTVQKTGGGKNKNVSQNGASSIPLANWRCTGDRSDVVLNTVNPKYHFTADIDVPSMSEQVHDCDSATKALKSLDKLTLSVWHHTPNFSSSAATAEGTAAAHSPLDSESELQGAFAVGGQPTSLAVGRTTNAAEEADGSVRPLTLSTQGIADEVDFWNRSEMLGKVNLDLKPLRYNTNSSNSQHSATGGGDDNDGVIASLEGWYHVFDAQDAVLRTSIGQVKCHVRFVAV